MGSRQRLLTAFVVLLLAPALTSAGIKIPKDVWQPNRDPGYCGWVSLKTLMLYHGWDKVAGLIVEDEAKSSGTTTGYSVDAFGNWTRVVKEPGSCNPDKIVERLDRYSREYGLKYKQLMPVPFGSGEKPGLDRIDFVKEAVRKGYGAVVSVHKGAHAVTLVDITNDREYTYDEHGEEVTRREPTIWWIDNNDVKRYRDRMRDYAAGKRKKKPVEPELSHTSFKWWADNDWDGWAVVIYPNPNKPQAVPPVVNAAKEHERANPSKPPVLSKVDQQPPTTAVPYKPVPSVAEGAPLVAPLPDGPPELRPAPKFPQAQPQPPIVLPVSTPKKS
jgi:hypothetical protein